MRSNDQPVSPEALRRKHESGDPPLGWVLAVAGLVALTVVACLGIVLLFMGSLSETQPAGEMSRERGTIIAPSEAPLQRFPGPNLQVVPREDWLALWAREERELNTYGWINRTAGVVRVPIERAMELLLERGLPVRSTNAPVPAGKSSLELLHERPQKR